VKLRCQRFSVTVRNPARVQTQNTFQQRPRRRQPPRPSACLAGTSKSPPVPRTRLAHRSPPPGAGGSLPARKGDRAEASERKRLVRRHRGLLFAATVVSFFRIVRGRCGESAKERNRASDFPARPLDEPRAAARRGRFRFAGPTRPAPRRRRRGAGERERATTRRAARAERPAAARYAPLLRMRGSTIRTAPIRGGGGGCGGCCVAAPSTGNATTPRTEAKDRTLRRRRRQLPTILRRRLGRGLAAQRDLLLRRGGAMVGLGAVARARRGTAARGGGWRLRHGSARAETVRKLGAETAARAAHGEGAEGSWESAKFPSKRCDGALGGWGKVPTGREGATAKGNDRASGFWCAARQRRSSRWKNPNPS
jgi:hypothetical protein